MEAKNSSIIIYQSEDGNTRIEVKLENETVWLTQQQLCDLYQTSRTNIVEHIQHIYEDGELEESATCRNIPTGSSGRFQNGRKRVTIL